LVLVRVTEENVDQWLNRRLECGAPVPPIDITLCPRSGVAHKRCNWGTYRFESSPRLLRLILPSVHLPKNQLTGIELLISLGESDEEYQPPNLFNYHVKEQTNPMPTQELSAALQLQTQNQLLNARPETVYAAIRFLYDLRGDRYATDHEYQTLLNDESHARASLYSLITGSGTELALLHGFFSGRNVDTLDPSEIAKTVSCNPAPITIECERCDWRVTKPGDSGGKAKAKELHAQHLKDHDRPKADW
jgi:hypothetical protein